MGPVATKTRSGIGIACGALAFLAACSFGGEPIPRVVNDYLRAVQAGEYADAYELTTFDELAGTSGAALTLEHFEAFYEAHPLQSYEVAKVTKLEQRVGGMEAGGVDFFVVDIALRYAAGETVETFHVEGEVLPTIQVEPDYFEVVARAERPVEIAVDGIRTTTVRSPAGYYGFLVIPGVHTVTIGARTLSVRSDPLAVLEGPASLNADGRLVLT